MLFLTRYPVEGASSRYRVYQYLDALDELGVKASTSSFMSSEMYRLIFTSGGQNKKLLYSFCAVIKRIWVVLFAWRFDLVVMQRELLPFGNPFLERLIRLMGVPLVFDYDDALFVHKDSKFNQLASKLRRPEKVFEIFSIVNAVSAGNKYLAESASPYCKNSVCIEVAEDTNRIPVRSLEKSQDPTVVIGWLGSKSTEKYLELIKPVLEDIFASNTHLCMKVIGGGEFQLKSTVVEHIDWSLDTEVSELLSFDIGLMPLPLEDWSKGKSGGKARTYMAAGVVPVCTSIGYNKELLKHGETGYLVTSVNEWQDTLSLLINNASLRERIGTNARQEVVERFSIHGQAKKMKLLFDRVINEQK